MRAFSTYLLNYHLSGTTLALLTMSKDRAPSRHTSSPDPHTRALKRSNIVAEDWRSGSRQREHRHVERRVRQASLTQEIKDGNMAHLAPLKDPDSIANMEKGV